jgi:hypothetical protein
MYPVPLLKACILEWKPFHSRRNQIKTLVPYSVRKPSARLGKDHTKFAIKKLFQATTQFRCQKRQLLHNF